MGENICCCRCPVEYLSDRHDRVGGKKGIPLVSAGGLVGDSLYLRENENEKEKISDELICTFLCLIQPSLPYQNKHSIPCQPVFDSRVKFFHDA
jgi:hypothetical protein